MNHKYNVGDRVRFIGRNPDLYNGEMFVEKGEEVSEDEFLGEVGVVTSVNPSNEEDLGEDGKPYYMVQYTNEYGDATGTLHESELLPEAESWTPLPLGQPSWVDASPLLKTGDYVQVIREPEAWEGSGEDSSDRSSFIGHIGIVVECQDFDSKHPSCLIRFPWHEPEKQSAVQRNFETTVLKFISRPGGPITQYIYDNCN